MFQLLYANKSFKGNYAKYQSPANLFGAIVSSLCLIHCVATPILFIAKPVLENTGLRSGHEPTTWWGMLDFVFLVLSFLAVLYTAHHSTYGKMGLILWLC